MIYRKTPFSACKARSSWPAELVEVESTGTKSICCAENLECECEVFIAQFIWQYKEGLPSSSEGGQSLALILGSYLTKQRRNLIESVSMQELA